MERARTLPLNKIVDLMSKGVYFDTGGGYVWNPVRAHLKYKARVFFDKVRNEILIRDDHRPKKFVRKGYKKLDKSEK